MKIFNKCICLTSRKSIMVATAILISTLVIASVWPSEIIVIEEKKEECWIPTKEDIEYQDSMYTIIQNTQSDVDTIKVQVQHIIERLDDFDE